MSFIWPSLLWLLFAIPLLIAGYVVAQRRKKKYAARYASLSLVKDAAGRGPGFRRHIPPIVFLLGLTVMLIAMARPQSVVTVPAEEGTVILAMDVSGSMRANDIQPSRLEAAKAAAETFVQDAPASMQIGVVSFANDANVVQAPTENKQAVLGAISLLRLQRATAIGKGLLTSLDAIFGTSIAQEVEGAATQGSANLSPAATPTPLPTGQFSTAVIILLTDGVNNQFPDPLSIINQVTDRGVRVYTVGIGTPNGGNVNLNGQNQFGFGGGGGGSSSSPSQYGNGGYFRGGGRSFRAGFDETTLKQIADMTGGEYFNAQNAGDLQSIYQKLATQLVFKTQEIEITAGFTAAAAILFLIAGALSMLWFNRLP